MKLHPFTYLIIILLVCSFPLSGSTPPEINISERSEVAFRFRPGSSDNLNNFFVKEIARYNFLNLYTTEYTIDFELQVKISENHPGEYSLQAGLKDPVLKGDIFYKDFDLTGVLMPSDFEFDLTITGGGHPVNLKIDRMQLSRENVVQLDQVATANNAYPHFEVSNIAFGYDDADRVNFENRINAINRYLAIDEMLALNLGKAVKINPDTKDAILPVFVQIYDIDRFTGTLNRMEPGFPVPPEYEHKMEQNRKKLAAIQRRLHTLFSRNIDTLKPVIDKAQLEAAADMLVSLQKEYLAAMGSTNHLYEPAYMEVIDFFGQVEDWQAISTRLEDEVLTRSVMQNREELIKEFTTILYQRYAQECDSMIAVENFNDAGIFAVNAKTFCEINPNPDCEIISYNKLSQTRYGIFDAYLRVAQTAMENQNLPFSYQYLKLAGDFQSKNSRFIISRAAVDRSLEQLAWEYLANAEKLFDSEDFTPAVENYSMSREIYGELAISNYLDLIDKQIGKCLTAIEANSVSEE